MQMREIGIQASMRPGLKAREGNRTITVKITEDMLQ